MEEKRVSAESLADKINIAVDRVNKSIYNLASATVTGSFESIRDDYRLSQRHIEALYRNIEELRSYAIDLERELEVNNNPTIAE